MTNNTAWPEIKSSLGIMLKIFAFSTVGVGLFFGAIYVYIVSCQ